MRTKSHFRLGVISLAFVLSGASSVGSVRPEGIPESEWRTITETAGMWILRASPIRFYGPLYVKKGEEWIRVTIDIEGRKEGATWAEISSVAGFWMPPNVVGQRFSAPLYAKKDDVWFQLLLHGGRVERPMSVSDSNWIKISDRFGFLIVHTFS